MSAPGIRVVVLLPVESKAKLQHVAVVHFADRVAKRVSRLVEDARATEETSLN